MFDKATRQFKVIPKETLYIGDSFENDVEGKHKAGWSSVWFNHRHRPAPAGGECLIDFEVHSPQELLEVITGFF
ncbi:HAD hydrolase-like protein [Streptococcus danieliae]|uniref:HAD hydrolase-like protein n=1 Tax=Streptococcus danieliae TaxID=747656 RepID=A0A7X3KCE6_9STRE|nr:HAD hydrolase-like protein [Streptococcus danieliae]